jgi:hypothetical protein
MKIAKYPEEELRTFLAESLAESNITEEEWKPKLLESTKTILTKTPIHYRMYGPYWWNLKKMFIDAGDFTFGEFIDAEWVSIMDYGNVSTNLIAAWVYAESRFGLGLIVESSHRLDDISGSEVESIEYVLVDLDMEDLSSKRT